MLARIVTLHSFATAGAIVALLLLHNSSKASCQLPDDMQRELNENLEQQARLQALRHQQQLAAQQQAALNKNAQLQSRQAPQPAHDPNNYSYEQVSPPVQYSYFQPFGDAAPKQQLIASQLPARARTGQAPLKVQSGAQVAPGFDLNSLNLDAPLQQPQLQSRTSPVPAPMLPLPQAQTASQPLSEADFGDITGGHNYGASPASDFGLSQASNNNNNQRRADGTDAQLAEFGLTGNNANEFPGLEQRSADFARPQQLPQQSAPQEFNFFENDEQSPQRGAQQRRFDGFDDSFAASQAQPHQAGQQKAQTPASLTSLLGTNFPGLANGGASPAMQSLARSSADPQAQRQDDNAMDIADLGERSDEFSGADLGGFEQPSPQQGDKDFSLASGNAGDISSEAASEQPSVVPYPDGAPQPVGTLWALTQPQSLSQKRYSALIDKGTYHEYPAYARDELDSARSAVRAVVARTPHPRAPGPGRYAWIESEGPA